MTSHNNKQLARLKTLLKELFQLDKPELDFGLYKIMHAKSAQITQFLDNDLLKEIEAAFGAEGAGRIQLAEQKVTEAIDHAKNFGAPDPETTPGVTQARVAYQLALDSGNTEAEIYDDLYRFFERYYDNGDFLSKRYYARENASRAAPYSVPYDGREVYLHWANKDQYYIKSGEYLNNFSFDLTEAVRLLREKQAQTTDSLDFGATTPDGQPLKVHMHLAQAQEGEHGNIKAAGDQRREFIPLLACPAEFNEQGELVLNFEYKVLPDGYPIDAEASAALMRQYDFKNKGEVPAHWMADVFLRALQALENQDGQQSLEEPKKDGTRYLALLMEAVPTDTQKKRPLLAKYIQQYTARNTMDYFIHKDLGGFLKRELDFYIKNELMRLDDIENADAPRVEQYLGKIKALRRIAHQLIKFLAQLEDFQKKLWLKKKFVTETQYCITLDRVPESLYPAIAANEAQREEWVKLFAIDEIAADTVQLGYSVPLTVEFLKENQFLLIDTALYDEGFKAELLASIEGLDAQCDGVLIHSENYQALKLISLKYAEKIQTIFIDPPYNTGGDGFAYKDSYKDSSWLSFMNDRGLTSRELLKPEGVFFYCIDEIEASKSWELFRQIYGPENFATDFVWEKKKKPSFLHRNIGKLNDYIFAFVKDKNNTFPFSIEETEENKKTPLNNAGNSFEILEFQPGKMNFKIPDGIVKAQDMSDGKIKAILLEDLIIKNGKNFNKLVLKGEWRYSQKKVNELTLNDALFVISKIPFRPNHIKDGGEVKKMKNILSVAHYNMETNEDATSQIIEYFGVELFKNPKPVKLVQSLLLSVTYVNSENIILDYFAGSGTTGSATININRANQKNNKYILIEQNDYFTSTLVPRLEKSVYSTAWNNGKPVARDGISHCFKYLRLESYEDTLNNLSLQNDPARDLAVADNPALRQDYVLNYWLDVETQGSPSLLNVAAFRDPTAYQMRIKQPGTDVLRLQTIDLIETFNWLIGLWVENLDVPQTFEADFKREVDPGLPTHQDTRLVCKRAKRVDSGPYWFRLIEGYTLKVPGDESSRQKTLLIWRKLTDDAEKDNAVLQHVLMEKLAISPREKTFAVIYVNGSHTLPNPVVEGELTKVRLIEEAFHQAMWSQEGA